MTTENDGHRITVRVVGRGVQDGHLRLVGVTLPDLPDALLDAPLDETSLVYEAVLAAGGTAAPAA